MCFSIADLVIMVVLGFFLGIFIMLIGIKFYLVTQYPLQFVEKDDWPDEDWVIGYEVEDES